MGQEFDHQGRVNLFVTKKPRALAGVFIDNVTDLDYFAMPGRIELEI